MPDTERKLVVIDYEGNVIREISDLGEKGVLWSDQEQLLIQSSLPDSDQVRYEFIALN